MNKVIKTLQGGTLGDAHCIYCRLYRLYELYGVTFEWVRSSALDYVYFDNPIKEYFKGVDIIKFVGSRTDLENIYAIGNEGHKKIRELYEYDLVGNSNGDIKGVFPRYDKAKCFPPYKVSEVTIKNSSIVIQIQGGKYSKQHAHARFFHIDFVRNMCDYFSSSGYNVYLIGLSNKNYGIVKTDYNFCSNNLIDELSLYETLGYVAKSSYFIGFDGIFSFFSASQRVPTIQFSHLINNPRMVGSDKSDWGDGCSSWYDYTVIVRPVPTSIPLYMDMPYFKAVFSEIEKLV